MIPTVLVSVPLVSARQFARFIHSVLLLCVAYIPCCPTEKKLLELTQTRTNGKGNEKRKDNSE